MNAAEQLIEQGREEGLEKGLERLREAIGAVLSARGLPLSDLGRARLAACKELGVLIQWHARAITAAQEADIFHKDAG